MDGKIQHAAFFFIKPLVLKDCSLYSSLPRTS